MTVSASSCPQILGGLGDGGKELGSLEGGSALLALGLPSLSQAQFPSLFNGLLWDPNGTVWAEGLEWSQTLAATQEGSVVEVSLVTAYNQGSGWAFNA